MVFSWYSADKSRPNLPFPDKNNRIIAYSVNRNKTASKQISVVKCVFIQTIGNKSTYLDFRLRY